MSLFPPDVSNKMKAGGSDWLSGSDFEGEGMILQTVSAEPVSSKYGVEEDDYWVQQDILQPGQTFRYTFKNFEGNERKWDTHSRPFAIGMEQAEIEANDWVKIVRTGTAKNTRYTVSKIEAPVSHAKDEPRPENIPF